jgi:hypothetical protein
MNMSVLETASISHANCPDSTGPMTTIYQIIRPGTLSDESIVAKATYWEPLTVEGKLVWTGEEWVSSHNHSIMWIKWCRCTIWEPAHSGYSTWFCIGRKEAIDNRFSLSWDGRRTLIVDIEEGVSIHNNRKLSIKTRQRTGFDHTRSALPPWYSSSQGNAIHDHFSWASNCRMSITVAM